MRFIVPIVAVLLAGCGGACRLACLPGVVFTLPESLEVDQNMSVHVKVCIDAACVDEEIEPSPDPSMPASNADGEVIIDGQGQTISYTPMNVPAAGMNRVTLVYSQGGRVLAQTDQNLDVPDSAAANASCSCSESKLAIAL